MVQEAKKVKEEKPVVELKFEVGIVFVVANLPFPFTLLMLLNP